MQNKWKERVFGAFAGIGLLVVSFYVAVLLQPTAFTQRSLLMGTAFQGTELTTWSDAISRTCNSHNTNQTLRLKDAIVPELVCDGTAWRILDQGRMWALPLLSEWTQFNVTAPATSTTQQNGYFMMAHPNDTAANGEWQWYYQAQPTPPYSLTAWITVLDKPGSGTNHNYVGVGFMDSALGDSAIWEFGGSLDTYDYAYQLWTDVFTSTTVYLAGTSTFYPNGDLWDSPSIQGGVDLYLCITNDGVNRTVSSSGLPPWSGTSGPVGGDALTWSTAFSHAVNTDLTPDRIMIGNNADNTGGMFSPFRGFVLRTGSTTCGSL